MNCSKVPWLIFCTRHFQTEFLISVINSIIFESSYIIPQESVNDKSALLNVMAWHRTSSDKPSRDAIMIQFTNGNKLHQMSVCWFQLLIWSAWKHSIFSFFWIIRQRDTFPTVGYACKITVHIKEVKSNTKTAPLSTQYQIECMGRFL